MTTNSKAPKGRARKGRTASTSARAPKDSRDMERMIETRERTDLGSRDPDDPATISTTVYTFN